jgi:signal transduction histidine kinase
MTSKPARSFRQFFEVPLAEGETTYRRARLLSFMVNLHLVIATAVAILFAAITVNSTVFPIIALASCLPVLGVRLLVQQGRIRLAAFIFMGLLALLTPLAAFMANSSAGTVVIASFQFITIIIACMLLEETEAIIFVVVTLLVNGCLLFAEVNGIYTVKTVIRAPLTLWVTQVVTYSLGTALLLMAKRFSLRKTNREFTERAQAKQREENYRAMLEKVIRLGKTVTEVADFNTTIMRIWDSVRNGLDFDRAGIFIYDPKKNIMRGSIGTDRTGKMIEEWDMSFEPMESGGILLNVLNQSNGYYFTQDFENDLNIASNPTHPMRNVKHYAAVACWSGHKPEALIVVDQLITNRPITEEQQEALRLFAGYAGLAIQNAHFSENENRRRKMLENVIRLGKMVTEVADFNTTIMRIWDSVRNGLDFDRVAIFIYDPKKNIMRGSIGTDRTGKMIQEWDMGFEPMESGGILRNVLNQSNGYYFTQDFENDLNIASNPTHPMRNVKHYAAVACWSGHKPEAVIIVDQLITNRPITEEQQEALRLFAGYAGLAIQNAHFSENENHRSKMMENVIRLGKSVTEVTDFHTTLIRIWDSVRNGLDFDRPGIFIYNPNENIMQGSIGTDRAGKMVEEWDLKVPLDPNSFFQKALSRPDGFLFTDDYEAMHHLSANDVMAGVKYNAAVACWSGDKPVAILTVDNLITNHPVTEEQTEALRLFAGYAGLAIQNARLNSELEERVEELGTRNAELERFTYTVSHELKSPIVTIRNFIELINNNLNQKKYETAQKDFQRIERATNKMYDTLSDLLELSRIGRIVNPYKVLNFTDLIQEAIETTHGRIHIGHITVKLMDQLPSIYGDHMRLREVFENLIENATKYMGDQESPMIEIGVRHEEELVFYVKDNGMGIEPQYHAKIFGLFEKLNPISEGTGIGLALVKRIIEVHGGRIWVESEGLGKGSTFCFTLPQKDK